MKDLLILSIMLSVLLVLGCTDAAKPPIAVSEPLVAAAPVQDDGHDAPRISLADAKKEYDAGTAVMVDVRNDKSYNEEHIKGALHIPPEKLDRYLSKLPKGKKIIAYCS